MKYSDKYDKYFSSDMVESIAKTQGALFSFAEQQQYDMSKFIPLYLKSDFCNNEMDAIESYFHWKTEGILMSQIEYEQAIPKISNQNKNLYYDVFWMGIMYRLLVFATGFSSKEIYDIIDAKFMDKYAISLELCDFDDAVSIILVDIKGKYNFPACMKN